MFAYFALSTWIPQEAISYVCPLPPSHPNVGGLSSA